MLYKIRVYKYYFHSVTVSGKQKLVLFSLQTFLLSLPRYIYGEDPDSQNDFFRFLSHKDQVLSIR